MCDYPSDDGTLWGVVGSAARKQNACMRAQFEWQLGMSDEESVRLELGKRTLVMGILNVTPDSFSDGGQFQSHKDAVERGLQMLDEGADILDIGGESTRPGVMVGSQADVSADEELSRVLPVIEGILKQRPKTIISVDTYKARTAQEAVQAGAQIVNDVSGGTWDPEMLPTLAALGCAAVLMHVRGRPKEWKMLPPEPRIVEVVLEGLKDIAEAAIRCGIHKNSIVLDPGFGFGKNLEENYPLLAQFERFAELGFPLLAGTSRKSFLGRTVARRRAEIAGDNPAEQAGNVPATERTNATLASVTAAVLNGAHIVRVHDVKPAVEAVAVADEILAAANSVVKQTAS